MHILSGYFRRGSWEGNTGVHGRDVEAHRSHTGGRWGIRAGHQTVDEVRSIGYQLVQRKREVLLVSSYCW